MATQSIWAIVACDEAVDKQREQIDAGYFAEAKATEYQLKALAEKLQSIISSKGGVYHISTLDRQVLEVPLSVAEELPQLLAGYQEFFKKKMAVGLGLTLREAGKAMWVSMRTNEIEMFDPEDEKFAIDFISKSDDVILPPNLFDPSKPKSPAPEIPETIKFKAGLDAKQSMEAENMLIQGIMQQLAGPAQQAQQQMQQQMQQQAQQQQQAESGNDGQPRDLMEALHGKQIPGRPEEKPQEDQTEAESADDSDTEEDSETNGKLTNMLADVNDRVSKLQGLAESNPEAFKKVITLVHKLVDMAKQKKVAKSETLDLTEALDKALKGFPVGTIKDRKKKVIVNGKSVWRSIISGQVKDSQGQDISVRSANKQAETGEEGTKSE